MHHRRSRGLRPLAWLGAVIVALLLTTTPSARAEVPYHASAGPAQSRGAVLLLHPGGWVFSGRLFADQMLQAWGGQFDDRYTTWSSTYGIGRQSVTDALAAYDALRAEVGPHTPICTMGTSAGAHLALMLGVLRDPACVVAIAAPTNLAAVQGSPALSALVQAAFGYDPAVLAANSPAALTDALHAPVLLVHEEGDPIVPRTQARAFADRYAATTLVDMPFSPEESFGHSTTTHAAAAAFRAQMRTFVDEAIAGRRPPAQAAAPAPVAVPAPAVVPATKPAPSRKAKRKRHAHRHASS
jgi:acetyl esterase/lipase